MSFQHISHPAQQGFAPFLAAPHKVQWLAVSKAFESAHAACETCSRKSVTEDEGCEDGKHGIAYYAECDLGKWRGDNPSMCPAINPTEESEEE